MAVRSGPFLGALVRAATHEAPPCLCTPTRPPLLSLLRTIPLHVVRPRIQNFSSCEEQLPELLFFLLCAFSHHHACHLHVSFLSPSSRGTVHPAVIFRAASRHISVVASFPYVCTTYFLECLSKRLPSSWSLTAQVCLATV